jgi:2-dehydropantoate 2-reductase
MPLAVFGTGALACAIGGRLARSGERVVLVGRWATAREAIARQGIVVHEERDTWATRVATASAEDPPPGGPVALVLVKSHQTVSVAPCVLRSLSPEGVAVTLQNGLGNRETLAATLGPGRVAVGVTTLGARLLGPGEVQVVPGRIVLGEEPATAEAVGRLARRLRAAGLPAEVTTDVERVVFAKLAANCAINPLTALRGVDNGALIEDPEARRTLRAAALEVAAVAEARGVRLEDPAGRVEQVARDTASNRSSMLQDMERGAPTEIDALCGAVTAEGRRLGVPTPVNEALWREVRAREGRPVEETVGGST